MQPWWVQMALNATALFSPVRATINSRSSRATDFASPTGTSDSEINVWPLAAGVLGAVPPDCAPPEQALSANAEATPVEAASICLRPSESLVMPQTTKHRTLRFTTAPDEPSGEPGRCPVYRRRGRRDGLG